MGVRARIVGLALVVVAAVIVFGLIVTLALANSNYLLQRVVAAHNQLTAMTEVAVQSNHYSEQIAERLLIGDPERGDFENARVELGAAFDRLRTATENETDLLENRPELERERGELGRIEDMRALYRQVDRTAERLFLLRDEGRQPEAVALFRSEIEDRLDADLGLKIQTAMSGEREEVAEADRAFAALQARLAWAGIVAVVLLLGASLAIATMLARSLTRPIRDLTEGAVAIGRGKLDKRIPVTGRNELSLLAQRFNEMADELEGQRLELVAARDDLTEQVAERTGQLADANARLTDLDASRVRFLGDISHELRTPLTVLRGEAEITLRGGVKDDAIYRGALEHIVAHAAAMGHLVDDLLFLARSEGDQIRLEHKPLNVRQLIETAGREASVLAKRKQIAVRVALPEMSLEILADERRLRQALVILIDNAVRYSPAGGEIGIGARPVGELVELTVHDHGIGIADADAAHLFERFYRGSAARRQEPSGSGLGLAIAKWVTDQHAGVIAIESRSGTTTASIRLPLAASV